MKVFIGLLLMLLIHSGTFAQTALPPSSFKNPGISAQNTIDHLNDIAYNIYLEAPDSARLIAERALLLAEKSKYQEGIGQSFLNIGYAYWSQSYYPIALFYLNKAITDLPKDRPLLIADCYHITGRTYADLGNYTEAFKNLDQSERFAGNDPGRLAEVHSERSYVYMHLKNYELAIKEISQALVLNKSAKDQRNTAVLYGRLSSIYRYKKEYKAALSYSDTTFRMSTTIHNNRLRAITYVDYARIYIELHNFDKAIVYAERGVALGDSIGVVYAISSAYRALITSYEQKNDLKQVMAFQKKYNSIQDSLNNFNKIKNAELIQDYFALNAQLNKIALTDRNNQDIKAKVEMQRTIIISLSLSLLIVVALLSVTYYFYKQKKLLNNKLQLQHEALLNQKQLIEAQTANLETISKIKDKLLAVIGHDLRTPLANLRNIVEMFEVEYISTEEVNWLMKDVNSLVKSAELTLSNLMEWAGSHIKGRGINSSRLDIFLIGVEMEQTFNHALQRKCIEFVNHASPGLSVLADENHIKVVLRNLISNAIKFTNTNGCIKLNSTYEENKVIISVEDNGKGMSAEEIGMLFYLQTHFSHPGTLGENGTGIGLLLCKELVELNGGKLWITSVPGKGSKFYFSLPLNTEYA
ncbi:MAG: tetratricopeptide repeat protein [Mucilaginibacter sp.]|nr:tetratricopeptide repeat protein [Mucilaginibacter sp.]